MSVITRVAGTGTLGNRGDGGPATAAELSFPFGVAVTADGGFLIVDGGNNVVRKVARSRLRTPNAMTGWSGGAPPRLPVAVCTELSRVAARQPARRDPGSVAADAGMWLSDGHEKFAIREGSAWEASAGTAARDIECMAKVVISNAA